MCGWTHEKAKSRKRPNTLLIAHASPPALLFLEKLKCALCSNILSHPLELTCSALVCTKCLTECIAASGAVSCPCCSDNDLSHVRPATNAILLCCYQMLQHCVGCNRDITKVVIMKGMSVYHHLHLRRGKLLSC